MPQAFWIKTEDWHTAGEPFRIVSTLPVDSDLQGATVRERRQHIVYTPNHPLDLLRRSLCHEPRGHADMYGGFITPPDDPGAHLGVLFWHKDGFSTACGHGTIALGQWAVANGLVKAPNSGSVDVVIDVPSGRVVAQVHVKAGKVGHVDFINVLSYQFSKNVAVEIPSRGMTVEVDVSWGGAAYAYIDVKHLGLPVEKKNHDEFVKLGREIKASLGERGHHKGLELYGVSFYEHLSDSAEYLKERNVVVFADGQIDRSPCGSGTAARAAILLAENRIGGSTGKKLKEGSIVGTEFVAGIDEERDGPMGFVGCIPRISGRANLMSRNEFWIDPEDPTYPGFVFR